MLRLRSRILTHLLSAPFLSPIPLHLHRILSAASPAVSPNLGFDAEDYLVATCGLTRAQTLKASTKLSHLKSPTNLDAVLAFLAGLGLSRADVATVVAKDPKFLREPFLPTPSASLALGSRIPRSRASSRSSPSPSVADPPSPGYPTTCRSTAPTRTSSCAGLDARDIAKLCIAVPRMLNNDLERVQAMVVCAEAVGVHRGSRMFRRALHAVAFLSEEKIAAKVENLKNTFRWSDAEVGLAVSKNPMVLVCSKENLHSRSEFLISEAGLEPAYIAHRPALLSYSLEARLRPRYCSVKFLKDNGLLKHDPSYYTVAKVTEKEFVEKFICPHKEIAPHLAEDYATACRGEVPINFRFK
ncbi:unnamed protein product [Alopecurus aequalis]